MVCDTSTAGRLLDNTVPGYMSYHHLNLWDRHRRATIAIMAVFFITYIPGIALVLKATKEYHGESS